MTEDFLSSQQEYESNTPRDALRILRKDMFSEENRFDGSLLDANAPMSVPPRLLSFIRGILGGAGESDSNDNIPQSIMSLTQ